MSDSVLGGAHDAADAQVSESLGVHQGGRRYQEIHLAIADATLVLLAERGYAVMVMDDAASAAGVSKRTVYRHFASKLELAIAAIEVLPTFEGWTDGDDTTAKRFRRAVDIASGHRDLLTPVLATAIVHRDTAPELLETLRRRVLQPRADVIAELIQSGQRRGEIRREVDAASIAALSLGVPVNHWAGMVDLGDAETRADRVVAAVWPLIAVETDLREDTP